VFVPLGESRSELESGDRTQEVIMFRFNPGPISFIKGGGDKLLYTILITNISTLKD
jgi:hypothetical protein